MRLTPEQVKNAITLYESGLSFAKVGQQFGVSGTSIRGLLSRRGIEPRTLSQAKRRISCNHRYFDEPIDEARAYWIGFILADGSVNDKKYGQVQRVTVRLAEKDRGHLIKLAAALDSGHAIARVPQSVGQDGAQFSVASAELVGALNRFNVLPRKSANHCFSDAIPAALLRHYFRGYFDGNGGISRHSRSKWTINCSASDSFLRSFVKWIGSQLGGHDAAIIIGDGIHRVAWCGTHRCKEVLGLMYDGAEVFLDRKMTMYKEICHSAETSRRGPYNRR